MSSDFEKQLLLQIGEISGTVKAIDKKVDGLSDRVTDLEAHPRKRWEMVVSSVIAVISGIVAGIFSPFTRS